MAFRLVVVEGPRKAEEFVIKDSIIVGRKSGDLRLQDPKVSTLHAKITCENDEIEIEDLDSSNGVFVNGKRVKKAQLKIGDQIVLGKTSLRLDPYVVTKEPEDLNTWQSHVDTAMDQLHKRLEKFPKTAAKAKAFDPPLVLEFVGGIQTGQKIIFGFGPRTVGSFCNDALLSELGLPPVAFEVHPADGALCELKTKEFPVMVNGASVKTSLLKNGDRISIGRTVILVRHL